MPAVFRKFNYNNDFLRVRDFLIQTYKIFQKPINWRIERWEYAFHFVVPYFSNWDGIDPSQEKAYQTRQFLESLTGLWETPAGKIAGVVNVEHPHLEHPGFGEFFIQQHPDHVDLFPEMLTFAEKNLSDPNQHKIFSYVSQDDFLLRELLQDHGFSLDNEDIDVDSQLDLNLSEIPQRANLPEGFKIHSMADDNNLEKRCKAFGCAFNHPDPIDWPPVLAYEWMQQAPDHHKEYDVVVVAPDGEFASFCLIWFDEANQIASLEPVGTQPEYRRLGLAREAVFEAIRRVKKKGAKKIEVGSDQEIYLHMGFKPINFKIRYQKLLM